MNSEHSSNRIKSLASHGISRGGVSLTYWHVVFTEGRIVASSSPTEATSPQSPSLSSKFPRKKPVPLPRGKHHKSPLVGQETGIYENLRQEHGSNISFEQYKHSYQASSTPKLARRDAENEEDTTAENTTGTGDSGISEWIAGMFTSCDMLVTCMLHAHENTCHMHMKIHVTCT